MQPIRQVRAGELDVGYYEAGPASGTPVLLLHGYPYDIHSYVEVAPLLAAKGYRVIVPHLRGHGTTRFLDDATMRSGQQSAVALDQIALLDALHIERAVIAGYDWGARTACIMAALWPQRCLGLLSVNGYIVNNLAANLRPLPAQAEHGWWYQYYFATDRGREGLRANRRDIARILWKTNSPRWNFSDASFERTAASFDNPDYVDIVVHNYRWRLSLAEGDARIRRVGAAARRAAHNRRPDHHDGWRLRRRCAGHGWEGQAAKFTGSGDTWSWAPVTTCRRKRRGHSPTQSQRSLPSTLERPAHFVAQLPGAERLNKGSGAARSDGSRAAPPSPVHATRIATCDVAARGLRVRAQQVCRVHELLRDRQVDAGKRHVQAGLQEIAVVVESQVDLRLDRQVLGQADLHGLSGLADRADEAGRPARGEQLLGVRPRASRARRGQLDVETAIGAARGPGAAAGGASPGRVDDLVDGGHGFLSLANALTAGLPHGRLQRGEQPGFPQRADR